MSQLITLLRAALIKLAAARAALLGTGIGGVFTGTDQGVGKQETDGPAQGTGSPRIGARPL